MKWFPLFPALLLACASCTTLENRRDLYRAPGEGYENFSRHPPPTRLPASGPVNRGATTGAPGTEHQGVITFPEETLPGSGG